MGGSVNIYIILKLFLLFTFICCGYGISKGKKEHYWLYSGIAILFYSIIQGLRYGRGVDYLHYKFQYEHIEVYTDYREWGFVILNKFFNVLDLPYYIVFVFYSFILVLSLFILLKQYREIAVYFLPIFLIVTIGHSENLIRQYIGFSFVYLSFLFLMKDRLWKCFLFIFIGFLFHSSCVVLLPFFLLFKYIKIPFKSPYLLIAIYLVVFFFWKIEYWKDYIIYLQFLDSGGGGQFSAYIENAERWFSEEGSLGVSQSIIFIFRELVSRVILIYWGAKLLDKNHRFQIPFFLFYISVIALRMAFDIEIIFRIAHWFSFFEIFVAGFVLTYTERNTIITKCAMWFLIFHYMYSYISPFLSVGSQDCMFVWDVQSFGI
ncbi:EpsG family protein [Prevotella sp. 10(H)]|uniref:EpsG family protein n=1 Tax=Prevotella sp. 10(H) TaxID=1158294 RepID=UPI0004A6E3D2|nr:EpsG family protein [Prevotella sp. 10(H)]